MARLDSKGGLGGKAGQWLGGRIGQAKIELAGAASGFLQRWKLSRLALPARNFCGARCARWKRSYRSFRALTYHDSSSGPQINSSVWRKNGCISRAKHLQTKRRPRNLSAK